MDALRQLDRMGTQVMFGEGERVVEEGDDPEQVCVVCKGVLKLTTSSAEGRILLLRLVGPGDVLGLAAALKGTKYEATAEALEECEVRVIGRGDFLDFMAKFQGVGTNSAETIAREYETAVLSARRLALSASAAGRLAGVLLDWGRMSLRKSAVVDEPQPKGDTALRFRMPLTHEELGNMAGISRETTTRVLTKLRREGLLELDGERMVLPVPSRLERLYC
jgi:CRP/FNR family transcriptional regulator